MTREKEVAQILLNVGAVAINPEEPFIWASGIESPIYCDNRLTMADPVGRKEIAEGLAANALVAENVEVCGIVSIFTYELQKADEKFAEANLSYHSLTNFAALAEVA